MYKRKEGMAEAHKKNYGKQIKESMQAKPIASTCLVKDCKCKEGESYKMKLSVRGSQWMQFAAKVLNHIENYTVPQYGDWPDDPIEGWKAEFCTLAAEKYMNRRGKAQRPGEELLDIIKTVHVLQITHDKMEIENAEISKA